MLHVLYFYITPIMAAILPIEGNMTLEDENLQADVIDDNLDPVIEGDNVDENSDSEPENTEGNDQAEKVQFTPEQQEKLNDVINKKVAKTREVERKNAELERQLQEAQAKIPVEARPVLPELPDPYDDRYNDILRKREEVLVEQARFDERAANQERQQQEILQQQAREQERKIVDMVTTYSGRAEELGMTPEQSQESMGKIANLGMHPDLLTHIVLDKKGPAINQHLLSNPMAVEEMQGMTVAQAAVHIETVIKPSLPSKKTTNTPPPPKDFDGGGSPPSDGLPQGMKIW
jgi:multidrug efflux pump subunit AcrA (membrane-fusion protein)